MIFSCVLVAMLIAYGVAMAAIRSLTMRSIVIVVVILHLILLLSPPLQLSDIFNYMGYARLGALHHISPYTHGISSEHFDPIFQFASWDNLKSPYGELFTAVSYPLAFLPLPVAFWVIKVVVVLLSLGFLALVWWCAVKLDRDPRFVVGFVALNPIYLLYAVAGFHNDFLMLVASMAAIAFVLSGRDRSAGAALVVAIAVKFTAILLAPFLLVAVGTRQRSKQLVIGGLIAAIPLVVLSVILFGTSLPNLQQQSSLITELSISNLVGLLLHVGGATSTVLYLGRPVRRRGRAVLLPAPARLAGRRRVVDAGAAGQPRVAGAVVHRLGAAAGGAGHEPVAAADDRGDDGVPGAVVRPGRDHVPVRTTTSTRSIRRLGGPLRTCRTSSPVDATSSTVAAVTARVAPRGGARGRRSGKITRDASVRAPRGQQRRAQR